MGLLTTVVLTVLLYTKYNWITFLYIAWVAYDWKTPLRGGRTFK